ncbi:MAG: site-specific DNA-methyltransferase [Dehalococcoidia bacterium]
MSRLNDLIRQLRVKDPALADDIAREVSALADRRTFGLNFERHIPEVVELPGRRVRRGDKVRILPPRGTAPRKADERLWRVSSVSATNGAPTADLEALHADETTSADVADVVVVAEFRDPIYPGLVSTGRIERGGDTPFHVVVNAENYHALQTLLFTHRGKVDCIYIDPPYNTGNAEWIYNDRYVGIDDLYRHSKWLAFIERRLLLARELLADTGAIIVAIGDDEHHRLRMLMDQVFGDQNFIANVTWQGSGKNDAKYTAGGVDYMLIYTRNLDALVASGRVWREPKPGIDQALSLGARAWAESNGDPAGATKLYRAYLRKIKSELEPAVFRYDQIDTEGRVFRTFDLASPNLRENLRYPIAHPLTGRLVRTPEKGWRYSPDTMNSFIEHGRVLFGPDETTSPTFKRYLADQDRRVPYPSFVQSRMPGSKHVEGALGDRRFPNPKDHGVLMRWFRAIADQNAVILDFFGGSGSTTEAVMRLNAEDGGARRSILVTNNELDANVAKDLTRGGFRHGDSEWEAKGVHEYVTRPRLTAVTAGQRPDGSTYDDTVAANVEFFTLTYEAPLRVASNREFERIAALLWLRAGARGRRIDDVSKGWDVAEAYGVIADFDHSEEFLKALAEQPDVSVAFIVTDEDWLFESMCRELPETVEPVRLYEAYLRNFELESGRGAR